MVPHTVTDKPKLPTSHKVPEDASPDFIALMESLGFCVIGPRHSQYYWRNEQLGLSLNVYTPFFQIAHAITQAIEQKAVKRQQAALRDALLPAMGLTTTDVRMSGEHWDTTLAESVVQVDS